MSKYRSIYAEIPDKARIIWTFFSFVPAVLIMTLSGVAAVGVILGNAMLKGNLQSLDNAKAFMDELTGTEPLVVVSPFLFFILLTFFWARIVEGRKLSTIGFTGGGWFGKYLRGFATGAAFLLVVIGTIFLAGGYEIENAAPVVSAPSPLMALTLIGAFLLVFLVQGAAEEVVFRGWWMSAVAARRGPLVGLIVTALFFALAHMGNVWPPTTESMIGVANIILFGLFIGLYALKEGSLWGVCGWHSAWNWLLGLGFGLEVSGQKIGDTPLIVDLADKDGAAPLLTGGDFGPEASLVVTGVLTLGCAWLLTRGALKRG